MTDSDLLATPLHDLHVELGARMVPFAGYAMPVQYPAGILKEHAQTRERAGLFDVSHMGQARLRGADPAAAFERLVPGDIAGLSDGQMRYTLLLNDRGGIRDDLMATRLSDSELFLVVNAACKDADFAHIETSLAGDAELNRADDRALLALQGPAAADVLARHADGPGDLAFLTMGRFPVTGVDCLVSRSGYTGEDGFEISVPNDAAEALARTLLAEPEVGPVGLGARDSLRLEAGLCLYSHDIDTETTPIEAALAWTVAKRRREAADFPGAETILRQLAEKPARRRVGLRPEGRTPAREGAEIQDADGNAIGHVTSGGFGPTVGGPVAMGYVARAHAAAGTDVTILVRERAVAAEVVKLPFVAPNYRR